MEDENTPEHIAIILDGNRRFAKRLMLEPWKGHEYGRKKVDELLSYAKDFGIKEMTFYALSVENIKSRPEKELSFLYNIFRDMFKGMDMDNVEKNEIRLKFIVNFCVAYGGRQELVEAVKNILKNKVNAEDVNEDLIQDNLYLKSEPDMIIRTGGEKRSSNFLPWQSGYSEWFFLEKMWPEFEKEDLAECIEGFKNRKRNFGK